MKRSPACPLLSALAVLLCVLFLVVPAEAAAGDKLIAVTFDDGPGLHTDRLLDGLAERGVKVTFFMLGECAAGYPGVVARVWREGHQIANHSYHHPNLLNLTDGQIGAEIRATNGVLAKNSGGASDFLVRVPYGNSNDRVLAAVGAPVIGWSVDPMDWKYRDARTVRNNIVSAAFDGAIVLVHDIHSTSVDGALGAIDDLRAMGYECVTVRELFRRRGVTLYDGCVYRSCPPNGTDAGPVPAPVISEEIRDGRLTVTITASAGASVWYSTDGSSPVPWGALYSGPFVSEPGKTVRAVASLRLNGSRSAEASLTLKKRTAEPPVMTVEGVILSFASPADGAEIRYTLDGSVPSAASLLYAEPVKLEPGTTVRAVAVREGYEAGAERAGWYSDRGNFFRDVFPSDWFAAAVDRTSAEGWLAGIGGDRFAPDALLTRGQLTAVLWRMAGKPEAEEEKVFADVPADAWYAGAAAWAFENRIAAGKSADRFAPEDAVTRQELAVMLHRALSAQDLVIPAGDPVSFRDADAVADWASAAVDRMSAAGILKGDTGGQFRPTASCTRAQAAAVFVRLADLTPEGDWWGE